MTEKNTNLLPNQFTVRLGDEELEYINENIEFIRGDDHDISRSRLLVKAFTKAIQNSKALQPKEVIKDNPELVEKIKEQTDLIAELETIISDYKEKEKKNKHAIVLHLKPNLHHYLWSVMQVANKQNYANSYEELFEKIMEAFKARNEFTFDKNDIEYLKTLTYEGPREN